MLYQSNQLGLCVVYWLTLALVLWLHADSAAEPRPNVLLIVSDDQRADTISALGNDEIRTPHLDGLVRRSSVFMRAVCANPICTPSRAEILSGCSGFRTGVLDFSIKPHSGFTSFAETLQANGYRTCYIGKWHNAGRPIDYGYETTAGLFGGGGGRWAKPQTDAHGRPATGYTGWVFQSADGQQKYPEQGVGLTANISQQFSDAAIDQFHVSSDKPFFIHVNFTAPHDPLLVPLGFEDVYDPSSLPLPKNFGPRHPFDHGNANSRDESLLPLPRTAEDVRDDLAVYYAVISHLDQQVGRILSALEETGQRENTIVIYTSDHGLAMGSHGLRGKQNMYEHTINVPMLLSGPGIPQNRRFQSQMYLRDLYPTVCDLLQIEVPAVPNGDQMTSIDGRSILQILNGTTDHIHPYTFGYFRDAQRMIRGERWKLIHYPRIDKWQLFDLATDPYELRDLSEDTQLISVKQDLQAKLRQWQFDVRDPLVSN